MPLKSVHKSGFVHKSGDALYILWNNAKNFLEHWSKTGFSFFEEFSCKRRGEVLGRCFCVSAINMEKDNNAENNAKSNSTDLTPQQIKE